MPLHTSCLFRASHVHQEINSNSQWGNYTLQQPHELHPLRFVRVSSFDLFFTIWRPFVCKSMRESEQGGKKRTF